jgi:hypothetical protein
VLVATKRAKGLSELAIFVKVINVIAMGLVRLRGRLSEIAPAISAAVSRIKAHFPLILIRGSFWSKFAPACTPISPRYKLSCANGKRHHRQRHRARAELHFSPHQSRLEIPAFLGRGRIRALQFVMDLALGIRHSSFAAPWCLDIHETRQVEFHRIFVLWCPLMSSCVPSCHIRNGPAPELAKTHAIIVAVKRRSVDALGRSGEQLAQAIACGVSFVPGAASRRMGCGFAAPVDRRTKCHHYVTIFVTANFLPARFQ